VREGYMEGKEGGGKGKGRGREWERRREGKKGQ